MNDRPMEGRELSLHVLLAALFAATYKVLEPHLPLRRWVQNWILRGAPAYFVDMFLGVLLIVASILLVWAIWKGHLHALTRIVLVRACVGLAILLALGGVYRFTNSFHWVAHAGSFLVTATLCLVLVRLRRKVAAAKTEIGLVHRK